MCCGKIVLPEEIRGEEERRKLTAKQKTEQGSTEQSAGRLSRAERNRANPQRPIGFKSKSEDQAPRWGAQKHQQIPRRRSR